MKGVDSKKCIIDIETKGFLPWNNSRVICIGIVDITTETKQVFHNDSEQKLLHSFIDYFNMEKFNEIIGYNVAYDIRFLFSRCLKYSISSPNLCNAKITDLMKIMKFSTKDNNFNTPGKLGQWTQYLFNKSKLFLDTSVQELYQEGKIDEIISYNHHDLDLTYMLWKKIDKIFGGEAFQ